MDAAGALSVFLGGSWASGINLYLTTAGLGLAHRLGWLHLPGSMEVIAHPLIILLAILLYAAQFFIDKIPYLDSLSDSVHTFIRPVGGAALGFLSASHAGPVVQTAVSLLAGSISMNSHLTKAATRAAVNTSPEPFTNSIASLTEDSLVVAVLWLIIKHPVIATLVAIVLIAVCVWLLKKLFRFIRNVFRFITKPAVEQEV